MTHLLHYLLELVGENAGDDLPTPTFISKLEIPLGRLWDPSAKLQKTRQAMNN